MPGVLDLLAPPDTFHATHVEALGGLVPGFHEALQQVMLRQKEDVVALAGGNLTWLMILLIVES